MQVKFRFSCKTHGCRVEFKNYEFVLFSSKFHGEHYYEVKHEGFTCLSEGEPFHKVDKPCEIYMNIKGEDADVYISIPVSF